ncbi:MAG TPA: hypothetical protein PLW93_03040, partial [Candidatus Absconditabacterales bacterium]|nr:hypothetical protein [Candidatus Absconditabacterales bacterium]
MLGKNESKGFNRDKADAMNGGIVSKEELLNKIDELKQKITNKEELGIFIDQIFEGYKNIEEYKIIKDTGIENIVDQVLKNRKRNLLNDMDMEDIQNMSKKSKEKIYKQILDIGIDRYKESIEDIMQDFPIDINGINLIVKDYCLNDYNINDNVEGGNIQISDTNVRFYIRKICRLKEKGLINSENEAIVKKMIIENVSFLESYDIEDILKTKTPNQLETEYEEKMVQKNQKINLCVELGLKDIESKYLRSVPIEYLNILKEHKDMFYGKPEFVTSFRGESGEKSLYSAIKNLNTFDFEFIKKAGFDNPHTMRNYDLIKQKLPVLDTKDVEAFIKIYKTHYTGDKQENINFSRFYHTFIESEIYKTTFKIAKEVGNENFCGLFEFIAKDGPYKESNRCKKLNSIDKNNIIQFVYENIAIKQPRLLCSKIKLNWGENQQKVIDFLNTIGESNLEKMFIYRFTTEKDNRGSTKITENKTDQLLKIINSMDKKAFVDFTFNEVIKKNPNELIIKNIDLEWSPEQKIIIDNMKKFGEKYITEIYIPSNNETKENILKVLLENDVKKITDIAFNTSILAKPEVLFSGDVNLDRSSEQKNIIENFKKISEKYINRIYKNLGIEEKREFVELLRSNDQNKIRDFVFDSTIESNPKLLFSNDIQLEWTQEQSFQIKLAKKIFDSPSQQLQAIRLQVIQMAIKDKNPEKIVDDIIGAYERNNLPEFAKLFKVVQIFISSPEAMRKKIEGKNGNEMNSVRDGNEIKSFYDNSKYPNLTEKQRYELAMTKIYETLLKTYINSNNKNLKDYMQVMSEGESLLQKAEKDGIDKLELKQKQDLYNWLLKLDTLRQNRSATDTMQSQLLGDKAISDFSEGKLTELYQKIKTQMNNDLGRRKELGNEITILQVLEIMFLRPAGFRSSKQVIEYMETIKQNQTDQTIVNYNNATEINGEKYFVLEEGMYIHGIGGGEGKIPRYIREIFQGGSKPKELLGQSGKLEGDLTQLDSDSSKIKSIP